MSTSEKHIGQYTDIRLLQERCGECETLRERCACGSIGVLHAGENDNITIECNRCNMSTGQYDTKDGAEAKWSQMQTVIRENGIYVTPSYIWSRRQGLPDGENCPCCGKPDEEHSWYSYYHCMDDSEHQTETPPTEYTVSAKCMNCWSDQTVPVKWGMPVSEMCGRRVQCHNCGCNGTFDESPNNPACLYALFLPEPSVVSRINNLNRRRIALCHDVTRLAEEVEIPDELKEFDMSSSRKNRR